MGKLRLGLEFLVREISAAKKKKKCLDFGVGDWKRLELTSKLTVQQRRNYPHT